MWGYEKCLCHSLFLFKPHISLVVFIQIKPSVLRGISETRLSPWTLLDPGPSSIDMVCNVALQMICNIICWKVGGLCFGFLHVFGGAFWQFGSYCFLACLHTFLATSCNIATSCDHLQRLRKSVSLRFSDLVNLFLVLMDPAISSMGQHHATLQHYETICNISRRVFLWGFLTSRIRFFFALLGRYVYAHPGSHQKYFLQ